MALTRLAGAPASKRDPLSADKNRGVYGLRTLAPVFAKQRLEIRPQCHELSTREIDALRRVLRGWRKQLTPPLPLIRELAGASHPDMAVKRPGQRRTAFRNSPHRSASACPSACAVSSPRRASRSEPAARLRKPVSASAPASRPDPENNFQPGGRYRSSQTRTRPWRRPSNFRRSRLES